MENWGTILVISVAIITFILIILIIVEKKLKKEKNKEEDRNQLYLSEIGKIKESDPEKFLKLIDNIARRFFKEAFKIKNFMGYSELIEPLKKKNKTKAVKFCETITPLLYSKERDSSKIKGLVNLLIEIINTNKIIPEQEQEKPKKDKSKSTSGKTDVSGVSEEKSEDKEKNGQKD